MEENASHVPVLLERSIELLRPSLVREGAVVIDGTLGLGGHASALLTRFPGLRLIGIDRDPEALRRSGERLAPFGDRVTLVHAVYDEIGEIAARYAPDGGPGGGGPDAPGGGSSGRGGVDGVLLDLGVSSMQLDIAERGFAYSKDAPLDMRMDPTSPLTAERVLAEYPESALRRIFAEYGEEKLAGRYARAIVEARTERPLTRSAGLVAILQEATPAALSRARHPAKRVFQALRIEVNGELAALERAIPAALDALAVGGRIVVLSYQSLEDRLVKREFARRAVSTAPAGLPVELAEHAPELRLLVRGAGRATEEETAANPRATPVRLRAAERLRPVRPDGRPATRQGSR